MPVKIITAQTDSQPPQDAALKDIYALVAPPRRPRAARSAALAFGVLPGLLVVAFTACGLYVATHPDRLPGHTPTQTIPHP
jgi:hypothetical protein